MASQIQSANRWPSLMDRTTAAAYWCLSERKFSELAAAGVVSPRKLGPRCVRYLKAELDEVAAQFPVGQGLGPSV
ncbi:hypothetical protein U8335_20300 [Roseiconus lacunae]|uniref:helix-turn-helix transcriptional regulator n=1 Tax=Roseiconus lacunae TaxID=2605694 RepID=UPI003091BDC0|nr:hypothetical protein U8335_20300 [Stieleria sp. HD01]